MNIALYIITPLALLSLIFSKKKIEWKHLLTGALVLVVLSLPFIAFEAKHNYQEIKAVASALTTDQNLVPGTSKGLAKLDRTMQLVATNTTNLFLPSMSAPPRLALYILAAIFIYLLLFKKINKKTAAIFVLWQALYIAFFSLNSLNVSEYYLDGMNVMWIGLFSVFAAGLIDSKKTKIPMMIVIGAYMIWNIALILQAKPLTDGYIYRKEIVEYIRDDSESHNYPCISVSYITKPGYNLGYRYLFYLNDMHVNQPDSGSPVYTIVFPLSLVDGFDKRFGDLGLILPDYQKYDMEGVAESCSGANSNLTDPMFGFTE